MRVSLVAALCLIAPVVARADLSPVATYQFQNTLSADQGGAPALTATDPLGTNAFVADTPYGHARQVYAFNGNGSPPTQQAGLTVNTTGLIPATNYSVEMVFSFSQNPSGWRRIIDVQNRQSDAGFYVDPSSHLDIFPVAGSTTTFTENVYHDVVLTVASSGTVNAYLDGNLELTSNTTVMNITDTVDNPNNLMNFFLDNTAGGGQGEYSSGRVGLIRLYNDVLGQAQISATAVDPFAGSAGVPEPSSLALSGAAVALVAVIGRFRSRKSRKAAA